MVEGILALIATLGALVATGLLIQRASNERLPYLLAWALTLSGIAIALAATALGLLVGFNGLFFRALELGGALIAPVWLTLGVIELIARLVQIRFAAWLFAISYSVVAVVILLLDPLKGDFAKSLPKPGKVYDQLPLLLIDGAHVIAVIALVVCAAVTALRASKRDREAYELLMPVALVALAGVLVVSGTRGLLPGLLAVLALGGAAGLIWFGAERTLPVYDEGSYDEDDYGGQDYSQAPQTGYDEQGPPPVPHARQPEPPPPAAGALRFPEPTIEPLGAAPQAPPAPHALNNATIASAAAMPSPPPPPSGGSHVWGQITVYTLLDGREPAFDRLAQEVINAARRAEPDTLIFTCHEVANAPTQRIFYQLFRDQGAFVEHQQQPHVQQFLAESRPHVLATNVIDLRLNAAKVVPLPSLPAPEFP